MNLMHLQGCPHCPESFWVGLVGVCTYVRGDGGSWMIRRRRAGLVVSLMSELDKEKGQPFYFSSLINPPLSIYYIIYNCRRRSCDLAWHWRTTVQPLVSIGLKDRDSCDSSGSVLSLKVETCLLFWLFGIAWDESTSIDKVPASDEKVDPVARSESTNISVDKMSPDSDAPANLKEKK